jgi:hypothetical protein
MSSDPRKMAYSRPDGTRADVPRAAPGTTGVRQLGYDRMSYPIGGGAPRNKFSDLAKMFDESPQPQPFAGIVMDEATPDPSKPMPFAKPLQPLKPRQFTPSTKPKDPDMAYNSADLAAPSARDDLFNKMCGYLNTAGADEDDLRQFAEIWQRVHKSQNQAMDSRPRRAGRPMTPAESEAYNRRFPDAARVRVGY